MLKAVISSICIPRSVTKLTACGVKAASGRSGRSTRMRPGRWREPRLGASASRLRAAHVRRTSHLAVTALPAWQPRHRHLASAVLPSRHGR
jgi:hypothetical protein